MKITEMCEAERPRERMSALGAQALSSGELLAILLRSGYGGVSALDVAQNLLKQFDGSLTEISRKSLSELSRIPGIKSEKACSILAALELGKRFILEQSGVDRKSITDADSIYKMMRPVMKGLTHEECWVVLLNRSNYLLKKVKVTTGDQSTTIIDIARIARLALDAHASAIVLVHNHPSGNPSPSEADLTQTKLLKDAVNSFHIALLDHVIICDNCYFSFCEESERKTHRGFD